MTSPLLARPGAVALPPLAADAAGSTDPDSAVAWHYGDPMREQRALAAGAAVTDLSHRGMVVVTGPDRLAWLHSLTTQHLTDLAPGVAVETLILSPHGHVEHALHLVDDGERSWLSVEPGSAQPVWEWLRGMRFRKKVDVADVSADWAAIGMVVGPDGATPAELPAGLRAPGATPGAAPAWQDPWPTPGPDTGVYTAGEPADHPGTARPWRELWLPRADLADAVAEVGLAGSWAAEALRVAAWRPREGRENDHRTLPHEADWLRTALHLTKGCYRGQETVARVYHLGKPPRRLVMLHLDGSEDVLPGAGTAVATAEREVGHVTTSARHYELGPIALALIKRNTSVDAPLMVGGVPASQEVICVP